VDLLDHAAHIGIIGRAGAVSSLYQSKKSGAQSGQLLLAPGAGGAQAFADIVEDPLYLLGELRDLVLDAVE
jgi:hypothetical protein